MADHMNAMVNLVVLHGERFYPYAVEGLNEVGNQDTFATPADLFAHIKPVSNHCRYWYEYHNPPVQSVLPSR